MLKLLQDLQQVSESEGMFPGRDPAKPLQEYRRGRAAINARAGTDIASHDLKRTSATLMVSKAGVTREIVARVLNHTDRSVTAVYDCASYNQPKRDAWCTNLTERIWQLGSRGGRRGGGFVKAVGRWGREFVLPKFCSSSLPS